MQVATSQLVHNIYIIWEVFLLYFQTFQRSSPRCKTFSKLCQIPMRTSYPNENPDECVPIKYELYRTITESRQARSVVATDLSKEWCELGISLCG